MCAEGFVPDGDAGCTPVLPSTPCPPGQLALPGDAACRDLVPCGADPWGEIPVEGTTQYVDGSYPDGDSDGTAGRPWTTIQEGIAAVVSGGIVAVAAGSYAGNLVVAKSVRLWGRCPQQVELVADAGGPAAILVRNGGDDTEIHGLAVTGPNLGIVISGAEGVALEGLWLHDLGGRGIDVELTFGTTSASVDNTLVETTPDAGIMVLGATATIARTVVRDAVAGGPVDQGRGIVVKKLPGSSTRANATVRSTVLERVQDVGIFVADSDLTVAGSVVQDTQPSASDGRFGRGIALEHEPLTGGRANAIIRQCYLDRNRTAGLFVASSDALVEATVIRGTDVQQSNGDMGMGIAGETYLPPATRAALTVTASLVDANHAYGIHVNGVDLVVDATVVRNTVPWPTGELGRGIELMPAVDPAEPTIAEVRSSVLADNHDIGMTLGGAEALVEGTRISDTRPLQADDHFGRGIEAQAIAELDLRSALTVRGSLLADNRDVGLAAAGSDVTLEDTVIQRTGPRACDGLRGRGLSAQRDTLSLLPAAVTVRRSLIDDNRDVGICLVDATGLIEDTVVRQVAARQADAQFGDAIAVALGTAELRGVRAESGTRAGITNFSATIGLEGSTMECNPVHLDAETLLAPSGPAPVFEDRGGNWCGCGAQSEECRILSSSLTPPDAVGD